MICLRSGLLLFVYKVVCGKTILKHFTALAILFSLRLQNEEFIFVEWRARN